MSYLFVIQVSNLNNGPNGLLMALLLRPLTKCFKIMLINTLVEDKI